MNVLKSKQTLQLSQECRSCPHCWGQPQHAENVMQALARMGASMTGIEPQQENISAAIAHAQEDPAVAQRTKYLAVTAEELASTGESSVTAMKVSSLLIEFLHEKHIRCTQKSLLCDTDLVLLPVQS